MSADPDSSGSEPAALGLRPGGRVSGTFRPAGSKSLAQRALVAASLAQGATRVAGLPDAADVRAALALVEACGARVERVAPAAVRVTGRPPGPHRGWRADGPLALGESGTLGRLALAAAGLCGAAGRPLELAPSGSLARRRSPALVAALRACGVGLEPLGTLADGFAQRVRPLGPPPDVTLEDPGSSQEATALLLALAAYPDATRLVVRGEIPSRPYLDMTLAVLARFGARVASSAAAGEERFDVRGPLDAPPEPFVVEPDASAAAVALAAACLTDGELAIEGLGAGSLQGDVRCVEHLAAFGCDAAATADRLVARGRPRRGAALDLEREPDLAPVMAAVGGAVALAARCGELDGHAVTELSGLGTLPGKESSRIEVLAAGLARLGLEVRAGADTLAIAPGAGALPAEPVALDPAGDHRMAFAFALLGLVRAGVSVRDPGCVAKSWPGFWADLERLGARVDRGEYDCRAMESTEEPEIVGPVLVCGGAGYIGSHTVRALVGRGVETLVLDDLSTGHAEAARRAGAPLVEASLADRDALARIFREHAPRAVVHFAAKCYVGVSVTDPATYYHENVICTWNLLEAMRAAGCAEIVFSSTCATYGEPVEVPMTEAHPQVPISPYGRTKLHMEHMMEDYGTAYGLRSAALRYFNAAGASPAGDLGEHHEPETHLIPLVLQVAQGRRAEIAIFGDDWETPDGTCVRDYVHVDDLADAHLRALARLQGGASRVVCNLGTGTGYSVREVVETARRVTGHAIPARVAARRAGDPARLVSGGTRARDLLGWTPRRAELETIVADAWRFQAAHPAGYPDARSS